MSRALVESDLIEWQEHPVTKELIRLLHAKREELRQQWEGGSFTDYEREGTVLVNVGNMGTCKGYAFVTDFTYETYLTEIADEERKRPSAPGSGSAD